MRAGHDVESTTCETLALKLSSSRPPSLAASTAGDTPPTDIANPLQWKPDPACQPREPLAAPVVRMRPGGPFEDASADPNKSQYPPKPCSPCWQSHRDARSSRQRFRISRRVSPTSARPGALEPATRTSSDLSVAVARPSSFFRTGMSRTIQCIPSVTSSISLGDLAHNVHPSVAPARRSIQLRDKLGRLEARRRRVVARWRRRERGTRHLLVR